MNTAGEIKANASIMFLHQSLDYYISFINYKCTTQYTCALGFVSHIFEMLFREKKFTKNLTYTTVKRGILGFIIGM